MNQDVLTTIQTVYHNFNHAFLNEVLVGPRREVTLIVSPLVWHGSQGKYEAAIAIRFGGVQDFRDVAIQFQKLSSLESEIGFLGPDPDSMGGKVGVHHFKFVSERRDFEFTFRCSNVRIENAKARH